MDEKLRKALSKLCFEFEPLSIYPYSWEIKEDSNIETFATDYKTLFYCPEFLNKLSHGETIAVLIHEIFHCVFLHPGKVDRGYSENKDPFVWMLALEQVTNAETLEVIKDKYSLPGVPISPIDIVKGNAVKQQGYVYTSSLHNMNEIEVYNELMKHKKDDVGSGQMNNVILVGDIREVKNLSAEEAQSAIEKTIATIQKMQKHGLASSNLDRLLRDLTTSNIPWKRVLAQFVSRIVDGHDEYSFTRPDIRHPLVDEVIIPATVSRQVDEPVVVVDTSGSISENQLKEFASGIAALLKEVVESVHVITTDAKVHESVKVSSITDILNKVKFQGGGGTDFRPLFEKVKKCEFMVFFTDGFAAYPEKSPQYPILWLLTKNNSKPPFGKVAYILEK